ncbi:MAG: cation-translocating P-type ATPase [Caldilinea sp.]|nr:cation-translocating P-type ATPase [Caldilineaceae bacterium]MCW5841755.1 cation-translocating P-type ATPase [Caldilinea sp.]
MADPTTKQWYQFSIDETAQQESVDPAHGLDDAAVQQRLAQYGPNKLAEKPKEPRWRAFLRQYRDLMQIILLATGLISLIFLQDIQTFSLLFILTVFNAVLGMSQEKKAEASLASLRGMMQLQARVRRNGQVAQVAADDLVPGDVVLFEAGDLVPADGRLVEAATLEIEEAALTGESAPTLKDVAAIDKAEVALGDQHNMAFMNTTVTRGRGAMIVTATGMQTQMGAIAGMMQAVKEEKTPLQKQLDQLTIIMAILAGVAFLVMSGIGLLRGQPFSLLLITGVSMAVAAIPTGLPAVVTTVLAMGTTQLAKANAIVKRLTSVETLGSTSAICSDKTGTLTLNQMTVRELVVVGNRYVVDGEGYSTQGTIKPVGEDPGLDLRPAFVAMALDTDASLDGAKLIGDPTEGALIVLAEKGGVPVDATREDHPRVAELPFDSEYKMMATFHHMKSPEGKPVIRAYVKGAPDVLLARSTHAIAPNGKLVPVDDTVRAGANAQNERLASQGMRVLAFAGKGFAPDTFDPNANLLDEMQGLVLFAMVGIVDPPRPEAKAAIAEAREAGIRVRMITGDHAVTAAAIAKELGIPGRAITGQEFAAMSDEQLLKEIDDIGVVARVAPEHKVRLVKILQGRGEIVAMTGDGVNDAPALKTANIGVAMGITGTEASKEAAAMILTDDNFATIVKAVELGRTIYDNLLKYIRFQLAQLVGFIVTFLGSALLNIAGGIPFLPGQILWINFLVDAPPGAALGMDKPSAGLMARKPRPASASIIDRKLAVWLGLGGITMAVVTLGIMAYAQSRGDSLELVRTLGYVTFSLTHIYAALSYRFPERSIFSMETFNNARLNWSLLFAFVAILLPTEIGFLQRGMQLVSLDFETWLLCAALASVMLWVSEGFKLIFYRRGSDTE